MILATQARAASLPAAPWFSVHPLEPLARAAQGPDAPAAEVLLYGVIGGAQSLDDETEAAPRPEALIQALRPLAGQPIRVRINSIGGHVDQGVALFNELRRHSAAGGHVTTVVDSVAGSVASLIASAGDRRLAYPYSIVMVHAPWGFYGGNAPQLRRAIQTLETYATAMAQAYAWRGQPSVQAITPLLSDGEDHEMTAEAAKAFGLIDEVLPAGAMACAGAVGSVMAAAIAAQAARPQLPPGISAALHDLAGRVQARVQPAAAAASPTPLETPNMSNTPAAAGQPPAATPNQPGATPQAQGAAPAGLPAAAPQAPAAATPAPLAAAQNDAAIQAAVQQGILAESRRRSEVLAVFAPFAQAEGAAELRDQCASDPTITAAEAGKRVLALLGRQAAPANPGGAIVTTQDERDKRVVAFSTAMMARASLRMADGKLPTLERGNPFAGKTLLMVAHESLRRIGRSTDGMDVRDVVAMAFTQSGSDFPVLLENLMHKALQSGYALQADTWSRFCKTGSVSDFRPHNRYRLSSLGNLERKNELGEYKTLKINDGEKSAVSVETFGRVLNISREAIINDDIGAFTDLASRMGRVSRRLIENLVYEALADNSGAGPTMADGKALFHVDHGNLIATGARPSTRAFADMRDLLRRQRDVGNNDFLDLTPAVGLFPINVKDEAVVVNNAEYNHDAAGKFQVPNTSRGMLRDIVDSPRLSGTGYYFFADPNDAPALEVSFLNGVQEPFMDMQTAWNTDGAAWKVRLDVGVDPIDYRGAVRNPGAALA